MAGVLRFEMLSEKADGKMAKAGLLPKIGRPLKTGEPQKRRNIALSDRLAESANKIGGGNTSEGIRIALEYWTSAREAKKCLQREKSI